MSIQQTSQATASLLPSSTSAGRSSTNSKTGQGDSFAALLDGSSSDSTSTSTTKEYTPFQRLFMSTPEEVAARQAANAAAKTTSNTTPKVTLETASTDDTADIPDDDISPAAPWPTFKMANPTQPELGTKAKQAIRGALEDAGMDTSAIKMSYWEELVTYPGGSFINRTVTLQTASGRKIDMDAANIVRSSWITPMVVKDLETWA